MEAGTRDPAASREDKGRFGDTNLQTTRQGEAETRLAPWGLVEELGNERRIQRLAVRDRGEKQWGQGDTGEMEWERNERHIRQKRVRWGTLRLGRVGTARTETKRTGAGTASEDHAQVSAPAPGRPPGLCALEADSESPGSSCVTLHRSLPLDEGTLFCLAGRMNHQRQCTWD